MNIRNLFSYGFLILVLGLVQILFLKNLAVFGYAFGFLYLLGLLILPSTIRTIPLMLIAFCIGFILDIFFETIGMHTAAATLFAFLKPTWLKIASPTGGFDEAEEPSLGQIGFGRYISYAFPLLFVYCLAFFTADQWGTGGFFEILIKSFFSALFTLLLNLVVQLLFFSRKRSIS
jgi:hypothetical protein